MVTSVILVTVLLLVVSSSLVSGDLDLHIFALPVGQGDATVIKCPDKPTVGKPPGWYNPDTGKLNIIDMGSSSCIKGGCMTLLDDIQNFIGNNEVENIFLTHPDRDHYNLLPALTDKYLHSTVNVYYSHMAKCYQQYGNKILENFLGKAKIKDKPVGEIGCNDPSKVIPICDDDATITIIASELGHRCKCPNVDSLVLQLEYKGKTMETWRVRELMNSWPAIKKQLVLMCYVSLIMDQEVIKLIVIASYMQYFLIVWIMPSLAVILTMRNFITPAARS